MIEFSRRMSRAAAASMVIAIALTGCGGDVKDGASATPPASTKASVGAEGGTVNGPDGVQVVIPAGALSNPTVIGIARSAAGAPATLPDDYAATASMPTYEFTPHDLVFNTPVTIRMPTSGSATSTEVLMASPGEDWQVTDARISGAFAEFQRNSFSWGLGPFACAPENRAPYSSGNPDPYPCSQPRGYASASATPATAITKRTAGSADVNSGSAGSWEVTQASTVRLTLNYQAAPDCQNPRAKLVRRNPAGTPGPVQTLFDGPVALTPTTLTNPYAFGGNTYVRGVGSTSYDVSFSHLDNGNTAFGYSFSCNRPSRPTRGGGDLLTFVAAIPVPTVTYAIGGTVSGLTGAGLVLQNNSAGNLAVAANGAFSFANSVGAGASYAVTVLTQPAGQTCAVQNGSGTANAAVSNVLVSCAASVTPLVAGVVLSARAGHTCALKPDSSVACWGINSSYQLGDGTAISKNRPVDVVGLTGVKAVAASTLHSCAIKSDTSVVCWGANAEGQLGDGSGLTQTSPVAVTGLTGATALSGGRDHTCAIVAEGTVVCWGNNTFGQLGNGTTTASPSPVVALTSGAVALSAGWDFTCAAMGDLSVRCWGRNDLSQLGIGTTAHESVPRTVSGLTGAVGISTGTFHACALMSDGSAACWGNNSEGQLGDGTLVKKTTAVPVPGLSGAVALSTGAAHNCALLSGGGVSCWGANSRGQIGDGTEGTAANKTTPVAVTGLSGVRTLASGSAYNCALKTDGSAVCWGWNIDGSIGDGSNVNRLVPTPVVGGAVFWK